jgi:hypothetical protein
MVFNGCPFGDKVYIQNKVRKKRDLVPAIALCVQIILLPARSSTFFFTFEKSFHGKPLFYTYYTIIHIASKQKIKLKGTSHRDRSF